MITYNNDKKVSLYVIARHEAISGLILATLRLLHPKGTRNDARS
jgi:hypothetical protein